MGVVIAVGARELAFEGETITVGRDPRSQIAFPDDPRLAPEHAVLRKVAGRWIVEARGPEALQVGDGRPTRFAWLNSGDVIQLTETGPELVFEPTASPAVRSREPERRHVPPAPPVRTEPVERATPVRQAARPERAPAGIHPVVWALGGAALVLGGVLVGAVVLWLARTPEPNPQAPVTSVAETGSSSLALTAGHEASALTEPKPTATRPAADALYLVLLKHPDHPQVYQLGTAWAVAARRLVTSAAIVQAIDNLRESLPQATVRLAGSSQEFTITGTQMHPEYRRASDAAAAAQAEADTLRADLEKGSQADPEQLTERLVEAEERRYQALERQVHFDVGVIDVDRDLSQTLAPGPQQPRVGARLTIRGVPFPMDQFLSDPDTPPVSSEAPGALVLRQKLPDGQNPERLLVKSQRDLTGENWAGSPVLNAAGQVVGVYSRPTPPPFDTEVQTPLQTHDIAEIHRLQEFAPLK